MADVPLYHEKQEAALCGVHCVNSLLQGPFFNEWDLAKMAQDLDELERRLMASQGVDTPEFIKYAAEESGNVAGDGMFSIQAKAANADSAVAKSRARGKAIVEDLLSAAHLAGGCISLSSAPPRPAATRSAAALGGPSEEEQLAMALATSRAAATGGGGGTALTDEQQLEMAIKASLGDFHQARGGGDAGASTSGGRVARSAPTTRATKASSADDPELLAAIAESLKPPSATPSTAAAAAAAPQAAAPAAAVPGAGEGPQCELCVRLPNNQRLLSSFGLQATVGDVLAWLEERGWDPQAHRLCTSFPRVPLLERTAALSDCGLKGPREILLLERSR